MKKNTATPSPLQPSQRRVALRIARMLSLPQLFQLSLRPLLEMKPTPAATAAVVKEK